MVAQYKLFAVYLRRTLLLSSLLQPNHATPSSGAKKIHNFWSLIFIPGKCDNKKFRYQSVKTCNEEFEGHAKAALQKAGAIPRGEDLRKLCE